MPHITSEQSGPNLQRAQRIAMEGIAGVLDAVRNSMLNGESGPLPEELMASCFLAGIRWTLCRQATDPELARGILEDFVALARADHGDIMTPVARAEILAAAKALGL